MRTLFKPDMTSAATGKSWKFMNIREKVLFAAKIAIMNVTSGRIYGRTVAPEAGHSTHQGTAL